MPTKPYIIISIIIIALVLAVHSHTHANTDDVIIGKVVKLTDGDTISFSKTRLNTESGYLELMPRNLTDS